jgi:hypothetical protein
MIFNCGVTAGDRWFVKRSLANLAKRSLSQLTAVVKARLEPMRYRPDS